MFYAAPNLVTQSVEPCEPWKYQPAEPITAQVRGNKEDRQDWYKSKKTNHCFYTLLEGVCASQRVSKENSPHLLGGCVADYDIKIPAERIAEVIKIMPVKPTWFETSLGGNFRLVWVFESPIPVDSTPFCKFILQEAHDWLKLDLLPGLDRPAFEETSRLYCNGCQWEEVGPPVPSTVAQAFFVACGKKFRFNAGEDATVPLDLVEKALKEKYPTFSWPGGFELETQGPSFWIPGSESPQSAIVKPGGMFSFAMHASKPFFSWTDLLGKEFTEKYQADAIARATEDIWWDAKNFWQRLDGVYVPVNDKELLNYFKVSCRLSAKPGQGGISQVESALAHIYRHQRVTGAAPFVFRRSGLVSFDGERKLNTYSGEPTQPAGGTQSWGPQGNFPFISQWLDQFFTPSGQLKFFLAPLKHYYLSALNFDPRPGQNYFLLGGTGIGKTFLNRRVVGVSVGGFVDASDFLVHGSSFNSHLMRRGHWTLDDDSPAGSPQAIARTHMMFKKVAANQQFLCNAKFLNAVMVEWMGRIGCTANLDFLSTRIVGPLDDNSMDKTNLFRCVAKEKSSIVFPDRAELEKTIAQELPYFLRWLIDWEPPEEVERDPRYGFKSFQEKSLLDQTYQSSPSASFREILVEFLSIWFKDNEDSPYWEGTVSYLFRAIVAHSNNDLVLRSLRLEQTSRYLEQIQKDGTLQCEVIKGSHQTRIWKFYRF